jgi:hypothetical protein
MRESPKLKEVELPEKLYRNGFSEDMGKKPGPLYNEGKVTYPTKGKEKDKRPSEQIEKEGEQKQHQRSVAERSDRVVLYSEVKKLSKEKKQAYNLGNTEEVDRLKSKIWEVLKEGQTLDEYYAIHSRPDLISVDMGKLGIQKAEVVDYKTEDTDLDKDPIVILMGISADKGSAGVFGLRLAKETGRRVVMISHPDSWYGETTKEFAKAIKKSKNFGPHTAFFKAAINQILGEKANFDICGVSAGAIMASEIIKDKDFANRIGKKNFIVSPGITPLTIGNFFQRVYMLRKTIKQEKEEGSSLRLMISNIETIKKTKEQIRAKKKAGRAIFWKLAKRYPWWTELDEGNLIISNKDAITYGFKNIYKVMENPNIRIKMINGSHQIMATKWEEVIAKMDL